MAKTQNLKKFPHRLGSASRTWIGRNKWTGAPPKSVRGRASPGLTGPGMVSFCVDSCWGPSTSCQGFSLNLGLHPSVCPGASCPRQRPHHVEYTSSRPITEVKQHWARLVLGWVTAWEPLVPLAFCCPSPCGLSHNADAHCFLWFSYGTSQLYGDNVQHSIFDKRSLLRILVALQLDKGRERNSYIVDVEKIHSPWSLQWTGALTIISEYGQCKIEKGMGGPKMGAHIATCNGPKCQAWKVGRVPLNNAFCSTHQNRKVRYVYTEDNSISRFSTGFSWLLVRAGEGKFWKKKATSQLLFCGMTKKG